jgi:hypothetical protein
LGREIEDDSVSLETEHADAQGVENLVSPLIVIILLCVMWTIYLYCQSGLFTVEVKDVVSDRMLTTELHTQLPVAKLLPQELLAMRHLLALFLGELDFADVGYCSYSIGCVSTCDSSSPPNPLSLAVRLLRERGSPKVSGL